MPGLLLYFAACLGVPLLWGLGMAWYLKRQDRAEAPHPEASASAAPEYEI